MGAPATGNDIQPDEIIVPDGSISSADGRFRLVYQGDANLVLYRNADGQPLWATGGKPGGVGHCVMQGDGNFVVYDTGGTPRWSTNTQNNPGAHLILQDDGNIVVYRPDGHDLWATNSVQPPLGEFRFDLKQVNGWAKVEMRRDGTVRFSGHAHNDAAISESLQYTVRFAIGHNTVAVLQHSCHLEGTAGSAEQRNNYWDETTQRPDVAANFDALAAGKFQVFEHRDGAVIGTLTNMAEFLLSSVIGSTIVDPGLGLVLFLGGELAGLIATGSLVPGSEILGGTLFMLGPVGAYYGMAAQGVAARVGQQRRPISAAEYAWANEQVFAGSLPAAGRIVITDTIGVANRAFSFPGPDGVIQVNLGPLDYLDPRASKGQSAVFLHELTHAWQLENFPGEPGWVAQGFAAQLGNVTYEPGPFTGAPYASFNIEQQAQIVEDWWLARPDNDPGYDDNTNPWFLYIRENIRTGTP